MHRERNHNFSCSLCNYSFVDNAHLQNHYIKHTKTRLYECEECHKSYSRSSTLKQHTQLHQYEPMEFICPIRNCGKHLKSKSGFMNHERKHEELIANGKEVMEMDFNLYEQNLHSNTFNSLQTQYKLTNAHVLSILRNCLTKFPIQPRKCSLFSCRFIQHQYEKNQILLQHLQQREKELKHVLALDDEDHVILPIQYLIHENPYECGIQSCKMQFPSYQSLYQHIHDHQDHSIEEVLNNQMIISSTSYYCPIQDCEFGYGRKSLSFPLLQRHFRNSHLFHFSSLSQQSLQYSSSIDPDSMTSENNAVISNEVYNNGNLIVHSSQEKQQITCPQ